MAPLASTYDDDQCNCVHKSFTETTSATSTSTTSSSTSNSSSSSSSSSLKNDTRSPQTPTSIETATVVKAIKKNFQKTMKKSPLLRQRPNREALQSIAYFDRSEIETGKLIGQGGFSEVYEISAFHLDDQVSSCISSRNQALRKHFQGSVIDPATGKSRFVLKHLRRGGWKNWKDFVLAATDMLGEASYLVRLDHPSIIKLRGLPTASWSAYADGSHDSFFIILDRLSDTMDARIESWRQEALSTSSANTTRRNSNRDAADRQKLRYSLQVASALEYLHRKRLVFRDLKPNNLGFSASDRDQVLLFDFGLCRELPESTTRSSSLTGDEVHVMSCVGTVRYAAPETLRHRAYNAKVDVHAWALVVWEMFAMSTPFAAYDQKQFHKYVVVGDERPPLRQMGLSRYQKRHGHPLRSIPKPLRSVLVSAWNPTVHQRSSSCGVRQALESIILVKK